RCTTPTPACRASTRSCNPPASAASKVAAAVAAAKVVPGAAVKAAEVTPRCSARAARASAMARPTAPAGARARDTVLALAPGLVLDPEAVPAATAAAPEKPAAWGRD